MSMFTLAISCLITSNLPWFIPGSDAFQVPMQYCSLQHRTTSITSHIHNWVLFSLCLHLFILSGVISPLISSSILGTYRPSEFIFQCPVFLPFHAFMGFSRQEYWNGLPFPSPVDQVLSELSTMTHPSWVALHGMAHCFIEFNKVLVHVIRLISFLWLWFSVCLPSDGEGSEAYGSFLSHLECLLIIWVLNTGFFFYLFSFFYLCLVIS